MSWLSGLIELTYLHEGNMFFILAFICLKNNHEFTETLYLLRNTIWFFVIFLLLIFSVSVDCKHSTGCVSLWTPNYILPVPVS